VDSTPIFVVWGFKAAIRRCDWCERVRVRYIPGVAVAEELVWVEVCRRRLPDVPAPWPVPNEEEAGGDQLNPATVGRDGVGGSESSRVEDAVW